MKPALIPALAGAVLLAACGSSPPTRFYELEPQGPTRTYSSAAPVRVAAVHLPAVLDRPQVVRGQGSGRLRIDDRDHWGAPLGDMTRRVLTQDLASRLPEGQVIFPRSPKPAGCRDIVVDIQSFQTGADGRTVLQASWSLLADDPHHPLVERTVSLSTPQQDGGAGGEAAAMSRLLGELADRIASGLEAR